MMVNPLELELELQLFTVAWAPHHYRSYNEQGPVPTFPNTGIFKTLGTIPGQVIRDKRASIPLNQKDQSEEQKSRCRGSEVQRFRNETEL